LGALILKTGNFIYILFLAIYGIDSVWTIVKRLLRGENIFEAHRSHLYQYLGNEVWVNKLFISSIYSVLQLVIGLFIIYINKETSDFQIGFSIILLIILSVFYLLFKSYIVKKYVKSN